MGLKGAGMRPKFTVEKYTYEDRMRGWGDCQENNTDESCYYTERKTRYRVMCGLKVVKDGFADEQSASRWKDTWAHRQAARQKFREYRRRIKAECEKRLQDIRRQENEHFDFLDRVVRGYGSD